MRWWPRLFVLIAVVALLAFSGGALLAQESKSTPKTSTDAKSGATARKPSDARSAGPGFETLPASPVLIVNVERIFRVSSAGRAISAAQARLVAAAEKELNTRRAALRAEEAELTAIRATTPAVEFRKRTDDFRRRVGELRRFRRDRGMAIKQAVSTARGKLRKALQPVLVGIMREWRAAVMLDARQVVLSARALDITKEAIKRLDATTPSIEVRIKSGSE
ncbi:MAG: OmpH family outer membrane protein [Neomegalonema sp.]|nr:OmpH family outer membrane protein [Neomegalonema sp.]